MSGTETIVAQRLTEHPGAQQLWDALRTARCSCALPTAAEDAVFRFYLPLAHARAEFCMATLTATGPQPAAAALQAAEVGLAKAVLAWRGADCSGFVPFALVAIDAHLRRLSRDGRLPSSPVRARDNPLHE